MKLAEFMQSWGGKALIATALFAAGFYFPLFSPPGSKGTSPAPAASSASGASAAR